MAQSEGSRERRVLCATVPFGSGCATAAKLSWVASGGGAAGDVVGVGLTSWAATLASRRVAGSGAVLVLLSISLSPGESSAGATVTVLSVADAMGVATGASAASASSSSEVGTTLLGVREDVCSA